MKLSAKLREETGQNPLIRAKIPVTILGVPFLSGIVAGDSSDVSFSLRTNFSTGPSLSVSYHPPVPSSPVSGTTTDLANCNNTNVFPFSVSLKSGISVHGSPQNSPLVFTARFNLLRSTNSVSNPTLTPSFSLLIKPQFGNFSLRKTTSSDDGSQSRNQSSIVNLQNGDGVGVGKSLPWKEFKDGVNMSNGADINGILSGIFLTAKTVMPVSKRAVVNCRWGVNFTPESIGQSLKMSRPVLMLNKIGIERVDEEAKKVEADEKKKRDGGDTADVELLKGVCGLMGKEMRELERQNREIMQAFEEMRTPASSWRNWRGNGSEFKGLRRVPPQSSSSGGSGGGGEWSSDFEKWRRRSKKNGVEEFVNTDTTEKSGEKMSEMENELKKAIQATSGS